MKDDFVTKEEIEGALKKSHPDESVDTIRRMVDNFIEEAHGSEEAYEKHLAEYRERQAGKFDPDIDEEFFEEVRESVEPRCIRNPEYAKDFEIERLNQVNLGFSPVEASDRAFLILRSRVGDKLFEVPPDSEVDPQITKLEELGFILTDGQKLHIQTLMKVKGINAADAMREVGELEGVWNHTVTKELEKAGGKEKQYYDALSNEDRRVLHALKAAQPEAGWTAQKFYRQEYGKSVPKPKREKEPMVPREEHDKMIDHFCNKHGFTRDEVEEFLNN